MVNFRSSSYIIFLIGIIHSSDLSLSKGEYTSYEQGVNDALNAFALLNLEQDLQNTNRTFGEMNKIVKQRLGVK